MLIRGYSLENCNSSTRKVPLQISGILTKSRAVGPYFPKLSAIEKCIREIELYTKHYLYKIVNVRIKLTTLTNYKSIDILIPLK